MSRMWVRSYASQNIEDNSSQIRSQYCWSNENQETGMGWTRSKNEEETRGTAEKMMDRRCQGRSAATWGLGRMATSCQ
ncbi:hypothetical protein J437_LFUL008361 [Ladona fulva]|uniref:Uncharacterized protein n=1 Tax=Ladona fulva TaxID=123851 RepID=A0A8K0K5N6_LADFU|nr:hypothetical protein J437_LFUL008361 [Ladona fulva]